MLRLGSVKDVAQFAEHLRALRLQIPCDREILHAAESPLFSPLSRGEIKIGYRTAISPMEGWDGTADGNPTENTLRRWRRFGQSGAKLIWGGEAVAVCHAGRANPNQLVIAEHTRAGLAQLRAALIAEHKLAAGSDKDLLVGLQLTHSGRYSKPNSHTRAEPRTLYRHPILAKAANGQWDGRAGRGIQEPHADFLPYRGGFGVNAGAPTQPNLAEPIQFLSLLESLNIFLVNLTAGSPYYNPHIQRPALYPPSDGYQPPEDPLVGVARQMDAARELKRRFPNLLFFSTPYTYFQHFLPHVAQAALREDWVDSVGLGRMVLTYPQIFLDAAQGAAVHPKRIF